MALGVWRELYYGDVSMILLNSFSVMWTSAMSNGLDDDDDDDLSSILFLFIYLHLLLSMHMI